MEDNEKKTKDKIKIKTFLGVGGFLLLLVGLAVVLNYFFIVLPQQKKNASNANQAKSSVLEKYTCDRKDPYAMPEEIKRALGLRRQRLSEATRNSSGYLMADNVAPALIKFDDEYQNCYNIQYGDLRMVGGAEGVFWFDDTVSSSNNLQITIDNVYKFNDDLLLAFVIQHEIAHAMEFIEEKKGEIRATTCIEKEQVAFMLESLFVRTLNQGEKDSMIQRLTNFNQGITENNYSKNFFSSLIVIVNAQQYALDECTKKGTLPMGDVQKCTDDLESKTIKKLLEGYDYCKEGTGTQEVITPNTSETGSGAVATPQNTQQQLNELIAKANKECDKLNKANDDDTDKAIKQIKEDYASAGDSFVKDAINKVNKLHDKAEKDNKAFCQKQIDKIKASF